MAIRQSKYIDITSGVGGASAVRNREFIARCFTQNKLVGVGHVLEFADADSVMQYFGSTSNEYKFAVKYFGFVSKSITQAKKISFARWSKDASLAYVKATKQATNDVETLKSSNKKIAFTIGDSSLVIDDINLSEADSIDAVLSAIQTALRTKEGHTGDEVSISSGIVTVTLGNVTGEIKPCTAFDEGNDLATMLGLTGSSVVCSNYNAGESCEEACSRIDSISDNFGSIIFIDYDASSEEIKSIAEWNMTKNYKYLFIISKVAYTDGVGVLIDNSNIIDLSTALKNVTGTTVWAEKRDSDYIEALPAALFATTDYGRSNATKTFMYQQANFEAAITNDSSANTLDNANVNYMGQTQFAGGLLDFTQDGVNTNGDEISVYCNEVWLKSSIWAAIMNLFLTVEKVPANEDGEGMIRTVMMDSIQTAIRNGTIQKMKNLTTTQKIYIGQVTGDSEAWKQVYSEGFVLKINIEKDDNTGKYVAKYILVYSKGDAIRKVEGSDILI